MIIGSREENSANAYFKFRAFIIDRRGHVAKEVEIDNKLKEPYTLYSHFYIHTEVASINELGHNIDKLLIEDGVSIEAIAVRSSDQIFCKINKKYINNGDANARISLFSKSQLLIYGV